MCARLKVKLPLSVLLHHIAVFQESVLSFSVLISVSRPLTTMCNFNVQPILSNGGGGSNLEGYHRECGGVNISNVGVLGNVGLQYKVNNFDNEFILRT